MSSSLLSYLKKTRDGMMFSESFEEDDFATRSGWVIRQGTARNSSGQAKSGIRSLRLGGTQDTDGYPVILAKEISDFQAEHQRVTVWFWDDPYETVLPGPFVKVELDDVAADRFLQIGVRNAVDTTHFCCNDTDDLSEDNFTATVWTRTPGWHKFQFVRNSAGASTSWKILLDGFEVFSKTFATSPFVRQILLQADVADNVADSFGFFDLLHLTRSDATTIRGVTDRLGIFHYEIPAGNGTNQMEVAGDVGSLGVDGFGGYPDLLDGFISITRKASTEISNRTYVSRIAPGDLYLFEEVNFGRKVAAFTDPEASDSVQSFSFGGQSQLLALGSKARVAVQLINLEGRGNFATLNRFYNHARLGGSCSLAVDGDDCALAFVTTTPFWGGSDIDVQNQIGYPWVPSNQFKVGSWYLLENRSRTKRQVVKLVNVLNGFGGGTLTIEGKFNFEVQRGDAIRALFFWPSLRLENPSEGNLSLMDARHLRYGWRETFVESVNP